MKYTLFEFTPSSHAARLLVAHPTHLQLFDATACASVTCASPMHQLTDNTRPDQRFTAACHIDSSNDDACVVVGTAKGELMLWSPSSHSTSRVDLSSSGAAVASLVSSTDRSFYAALSTGQIFLCKVSDDSIQFESIDSTESSVTDVCLALSPDGSLLARSIGSSIQLLSVIQSYKCLSVYTSTSSVQHMSFSVDSKFIASTHVHQHEVTVRRCIFDAQSAEESVAQKKKSELKKKSKPPTPDNEGVYQVKDVFCTLTSEDGDTPRSVQWMPSQSFKYTVVVHASNDLVSLHSFDASKRQFKSLCKITAPLRANTDGDDAAMLKAAAQRADKRQKAAHSKHQTAVQRVSMHASTTIDQDSQSGSIVAMRCDGDRVVLARSHRLSVYLSSCNISDLKDKTTVQLEQIELPKTIHREESDLLSSRKVSLTPVFNLCRACAKRDSRVNDPTLPINSLQSLASLAVLASDTVCAV